MSSLIRTLTHDAEQFATTEIPEIRDLPGLFAGLAARLEAELPKIAERSLEDVLAAIGPAGAPEASAQTTVQTGDGRAAPVEPVTPTEPPAPVQASPVQSLPAQPDVPAGAPSDTAGVVTAGPVQAPAAAAPAAGETRVERLRREADEAEADEIQAEAEAGTAAGADQGARVQSNGEAQPPQNTSAA